MAMRVLIRSAINRLQVEYYISMIGELNNPIKKIERTLNNF